MDITLPDGRSYPIHIGSGLLAKASELINTNRGIIVTDENVAEHWLEALQDSLTFNTDTIILPSGEASKSFELLEILINELLSLKPDRKTTLIAFGGGVVGDITGFAASILMRGIPFVQIPTTLLSQVDSSVGGKTGINTEAGKNLVGSFYQPQAVIIDTDTLSTLPERELSAGFAEVIKAAAIANAQFFRWLETNHKAVLALKPEPLTHAITESIKIKANIVEQDEREAGIRALLNLGHTFGHALEAEFEYDGTLVHGEAVAIGMAMAFAYSAPETDAARLNQLLEQSGLPTQPPEWPDSDILVEHMQGDKKANAGKITLILVKSIGDAFIKKDVKPKALVDFIEKYRQ